MGTNQIIFKHVKIFGSVTILPNSKEDTQVVSKKDRLVDKDLALCNLPRSVFFPEQILAPSHKDVLLVLEPRAVHDKVGIDLQLQTVGRINLDVRNEVPRP